MPTIALFGATGNVGKELLKSLQVKAPAEQDFLIFTRGDTSKLHLPVADDTRFKVTTLPVVTKDDGVGKKDKKKESTTDTDALAKVLSEAKVETCFLCIPQKLVVQAKAYVEDLLWALKKAPSVKRVVKVGTGNAAKYAYGRCHQAAEQAIRNAGLKLTVVEGGDYSINPQWLGPSPPGAPYVMIDVFKVLSYLSYVGLKPFRSMGNVANFFGDVAEPFLDLRDFGDALANCLLNAASHEGNTYKVYSDKVTMADVAQVYSEILGRKVHVLDMSDDEVRGLMTMSGFQGEMLELMMEMFARFKEGVYVPDESWDGMSKLCPGQEPRKFKDFAKEKVDSGYKPIKLW